MNEQILVKDALVRLKEYFGPSLLLYPPNSPEAIHRLEEVVGGLPADLVEFLRACNGLRVGMDGREDAHIWGTPEVLASAVDPSSSIVPLCFLPFRGDPTGERDWIVLGFKPAFGAVVRWDPWTPAIQLIATGLGPYLNGWVDYLKACYGPDGKALASRPNWKFETHWIKDPNLPKLSRQVMVKEWLARIADAACDGAACRVEMRMQYALCQTTMGKNMPNPEPVSK